ncbi:hypothetical protein [Haloplasma contractile]|nr:hypothetical protein [Haloplasma contractile]
MKRYSTINLEIDLLTALLNNENQGSFKQSFPLSYYTEDFNHELERLCKQYKGQVMTIDNSIELTIELNNARTLFSRDSLLNRFNLLKKEVTSEHGTTENKVFDYVSVDNEDSPFPSFKKNKHKQRTKATTGESRSFNNSENFGTKSNKLVDFFQTYIDRRIETYYQKFDTEMHQMRNEINDIKAFKQDLFDRISKKIDAEFKKQITTLLKFERQLYKKQLDHLKTDLNNKISDINKQVDGMYSKSEMDQKLYALKEVINTYILTHSNQLNTEKIDIDDYLQFFEPLNLSEEEISALVDEIIDQRDINELITSDINADNTSAQVSGSAKEQTNKELDSNSEKNLELDISSTKNINLIDYDPDNQNLIKNNNFTITIPDSESSTKLLKERSDYNINSTPLRLVRNSWSKVNQVNHLIDNNSDRNEIFENELTNANRFNSLYKRKPFSQESNDTITQLSDRSFHSQNRSTHETTVEKKDQQHKKETKIDHINETEESCDQFNNYSQLTQASNQNQNKEQPSSGKKLSTQLNNKDSNSDLVSTPTESLTDAKNNLIPLKQADPTTIRRPKSHNPNNEKFVKLAKQGYFDNLPFKK